MPDMDDFRKEDGHIDWQAYHKAQEAAGERCYRCGEHMIFANLNLFGGERRTGRQLCGSCKRMDNDKGEVTHDDYIRCPHCGHQDNIGDWDCDWGREKYEEGTHTVTCNECEKDFDIQTHVSYSYTSPPMGQSEFP